MPTLPWARYSDKIFATTDPEPDRLVSYITLAIPLLWLTGFTAPVMLALLAYLTCRYPPRESTAQLLAAVWGMVAVAQIIAIAINGLENDLRTLDVLKKFINSTVFGWLLIGLSLATGFQARLATLQLTKAIAWLGVYILILTVVCFSLNFIGIKVEKTTSLLGMLVPGESFFERFYMTIHPYHYEEFFGRDRLRLLLFYPWGSMLAFVGLCIFFIALFAKTLWLRLFGCFGGLCAIVFSHSRIGIASFIVVLGLLNVVRLSWAFFFVLIGLAFLIAGALEIGGLSLNDALNIITSQIADARSGASMARDLIQEESWRGFLDAPIVGHGWIGGSVLETEELPIGSHSSTIGLLYLGGITVFGSFVIALLVTISCAMIRTSDHAAARIALVVVVTLGLFAHYEGLYSFGLYLIPILMWIGGALVSDPQDPVLSVPAKRWRNGV